MPREANGSVESLAILDSNLGRCQRIAAKGFWISLSCIMVFLLIAEALLAGVEVPGPFFATDAKERPERSTVTREGSNAETLMTRNRPENGGRHPPGLPKSRP